MIDHYSLVQRLTGQLPIVDQSRRLNDFAFELGWRPSDRLQIPATNDFATAHLIVEHGLEYTAIISFLRHPNRFVHLNLYQRAVLAGSSYNSLVDWHITIDSDEIAFVFNRFRPPEFYVVREPLTPANSSALTSAAFQRIAAKHPSPDVLALDKAIIETISIWKRQFGGVLPGISNTALSALFNAIIFLRAAEDHKRLLGRQFPETGLLSSIVESQVGEVPLTVDRLVRTALGVLALPHVPVGLIDFESLPAFDTVDPMLLPEFISDFYRNRFTKFYEYDFSLISKHALSRIYEHYVSVLRIPDVDQMPLLPRMAVELSEKSFGAVYTPEYIARFFTRYLRNRLPLAVFQRLKVIDPACGSGIFLRAFLELQNEALLEARTTESVAATFDNITAVDIDKNACHAARLSLSLLSLVLLDDDVRDVAVLNESALTFYSDSATETHFDVVVANPPYVKVEAQSPETKESILNVLGEEGQGRPDLYLAILKIAVEILKPGGYGLFVLPETFLKSDNASLMRRFIARTCWIHCVVDLTAMRVFEDLGVYTILLIFQKRNGLDLYPSTKIAQCQDRVAQALQDLLDDRVIQTPFYSIHEAPQEAFQGDDWVLATPRISLILKKYAQVAELGNEAQLRQGMNTGADDIFILPSAALHQVEQQAFIPLLTDRDMESYTVPSEVNSFVFYPYDGGELLSEGALRERFPRTLQYLESHRLKLESRSAVRRGLLAWWRPERPRDPKNMLRPKIVSPHVVLTPRFGLDERGIFAISRAPIIFSKMTPLGERDHLLYLLGILNSTACFWHITQRAHTYEHGYSRLEISRLRGTRVPSFSKVDKAAARRLIRTVEARLTSNGKAAFDLETEIDEVVSELYGLTATDREIMSSTNRVQ